MKKWLSRYKVLLAFSLSFLFFFGILMNIYIGTDKELSDVADKIVRLHVVANSDSPSDQQLKLQVRDKVIKEMNPRFEGLKDVDDVKRVIGESLDEIESIARKAVEEYGKHYDVKAALALTDFPTKTYGNLTLPAGTYQALNIVIGEGRGKNWWCVMFPPLCFIDVAHGVVPEKTMKQLEKSLTKEEYRLLVRAKEPGEMPVKLRFKILELAKTVNMKLAKIGNRH